MNMSDSLIHEIERRGKRRRSLILLALCFLIVLVFFISMNTGYTSLSPLALTKTLFGMGTDKQELILFEFRLPRIVMSVMVGAALAVSGCILQGLTRNPLADPSILGITHGAGVGVVVFIMFFSSSMERPVVMLPFLSMAGGFATAVIIYLLAYKKGEGLAPTRVLLTGIAVAAGMSALMTVLALRLDQETYQFVAVWLAGRIWGTTWSHVLTLLPWLVILLPYVLFKARVLDTVNLGDDLATGMGVAVEKERIKLLAVAVSLAAAAVSVSGGISFIGLIAPHLTKRLIGAQHPHLLPASALTGGLMLIIADTLGRSIAQPSEIHAGIVVAVLGAPYFLYLLARAKS